MRAASIESFGQTPIIADLPEPEGDAPLGTVLAAGINPVDLHISGGEYYAVRPKPPYTPGMEGVARLADGRVVYFGRPADLKHGSLAERVLLDEEQCFAVPDDADPVDAVGCGIAGLAGWLSVLDRGGVKPGEKVVIVGATGASGRIAVQAAKLAGASQVVAVGRSEAGLERARALGADDVVRWHKPMFLHQVELQELTGGGQDLTIDFTWGPPAMSALMASAKNARFVQVGNAASPGLGISAVDLRALNLTLMGFSVFNETLERRAAAFTDMLGRVAAGDLVLDAERVPLDAVPDAWARQAGSPGSKLVVTVG